MLGASYGTELSFIINTAFQANQHLTVYEYGIGSTELSIGYGA